MVLLVGACLFALLCGLLSKRMREVSGNSGRPFAEFCGSLFLVPRSLC